MSITSMSVNDIEDMEGYLNKDKSFKISIFPSEIGLTNVEVAVGMSIETYDVSNDCWLSIDMSIEDALWFGKSIIAMAKSLK